MLRCRARAALAALLLLGPRAWALPEGFVLEKVAGDLDFPVSIAFAPPPDRRVFYADLYGGAVRIVLDGAEPADPFVSIPDAVLGASPPEDKGVLGLALDPAFAENGYVYVYYTAEAPGSSFRNRLVRYRETAPNVGGEPTVLLDDVMGGNGHNAGAIRFAPDGTLLVAAGDFSCCRPPVLLDPAPRPLDLARLEGKILRIEADGGIPADNPFVGVPGARPEIFAIGHRNPFKLAPDRSVLGVPRVYVSENGEDAADEVNLAEAGKSYGWPGAEGNACAEGNVCPPDFAFEKPIFIWSPPVSPTGIERYDGRFYPPEYRGDLFVGRANSGPGYIERLDLNEAGDAVLSASFFVRVEDSPLVAVDVIQGPDGLLYYTTFNAIHRIDATPEALLGWILAGDSDASLGGVATRLRKRAGL